MSKTITQEGYLKLKAEALVEHNSHRAAYGGEGPTELQDFKLTCDDCGLRFECEFAADNYNTDGDCLAEK